MDFGISPRRVIFNPKTYIAEEGGSRLFGKFPKHDPYWCVKLSLNDFLFVILPIVTSIFIRRESVKSYELAANEENEERRPQNGRLITDLPAFPTK